MKIDFVLTASNLINKYISNYPIIYKIWKRRFSLDCYLILISDEIPNELLEYKDYIILFPEFDNLNSAYISQVIRILYPALFENKNVLITDVDILPISRSYFIDSIKDYDNNKFITFTNRYDKRKQYAICYNIANSSVWKEIFNINSIDDIKNKLIEWYNIKYIGKKNTDGWFTDQNKLYHTLENWENKKSKLIILKDTDLDFKRIDKRSKNVKYLKDNFETVKDDIANEKYTDLHLTKKIPKKMLNKIIDSLCKEQK